MTMVDIPADPQLAWVRKAAPRRRGQLSDLAAAAYLGEFELRRSGARGDFAIFLKGTSVRVGTVHSKATQFARALMSVMEHTGRRRARNGQAKRKPRQCATAPDDARLAQATLVGPSQ
jgi:hypothetical protein